MNQNYPSTESKICLGTAQFGMDYGIANPNGQLDKKKVNEILADAHQCGVTMLDTAYGYGNSEELVGAFVKKSGKSFKVITKLPPHSDVSSVSVNQFFRRSLSRLGGASPYGYIIHHFDTYRERPDVWNHVQALKENGYVQKVGFSLYFPQELKLLLKRKIYPDIIQLPFSVLDTRFQSFFTELKDRSVEVHARSIFLQGAVFLPDEKLGGSLAGARDSIRHLRGLSVKEGISVQDLCMQFVAERNAIDRIVVGVDSADHLKENLSVLKRFTEKPDLLIELEQLAVNEEPAVVPSLWRRIA